MYRNFFHGIKFLRIKIVRNFDARHEGGIVRIKIVRNFEARHDGGRSRWIFELDTNLVY